MSRPQQHRRGVSSPLVPVSGQSNPVSSRQEPASSPRKQDSPQPKPASRSPSPDTGKTVHGTDLQGKHKNRCEAESLVSWKGKSSELVHSPQPSATDEQTFRFIQITFVLTADLCEASLDALNRYSECFITRSNESKSSINFMELIPTFQSEKDFLLSVRKPLKDLREIADKVTELKDLDAYKEEIGRINTNVFPLLQKVYTRLALLPLQHVLWVTEEKQLESLLQKTKLDKVTHVLSGVVAELKKSWSKKVEKDDSIAPDRQPDQLSAAGIDVTSEESNEETKTKRLLMELSEKLETKSKELKARELTKRANEELQHEKLLVANLKSALDEYTKYKEAPECQKCIKVDLLKQLEEKLEKAQELSERLTAESLSQKRHNADLNRKLDENTKKFKEDEKSHESVVVNFEKAQKEIDTLTAKLQHEMYLADSLKEQFQKSEQGRKKTDGRLLESQNKCEENLKSLQEARSEAESKAAKHSELVSKLNSEKEKLLKARTACEETIKDLENTCSKKEEEFCKLENELSSLQGKHKDECKEKQSLKQQLDKAKLSLSEFRRKHEDLEEKNTSLEKKLKLTKNEAEEVNSELTRVKKKSNALEQAVQCFQAENASLKRGLAEREKEAEKQRKKLDLLKANHLAVLRQDPRYASNFSGRLGISFENYQEKGRYQAIAHQYVEMLGTCDASISFDVKPGDDNFTVVLHFAKTVAGRTVDLEFFHRQIFSCKNVILILLRSGKNEKVFDAQYSSEGIKSGIRLGLPTEKKAVIQLLHWNKEILDCELNKTNIQLLQGLILDVCPQLLHKPKDDVFEKMWKEL